MEQHIHLYHLWASDESGQCYLCKECGLKLVTYRNDKGEQVDVWMQYGRIIAKEINGVAIII